LGEETEGFEDIGGVGVCGGEGVWHVCIFLGGVVHWDVGRGCLLDGCVLRRCIVEDDVFERCLLSRLERIINWCVLGVILLFLLLCGSVLGLSLLKGCVLEDFSILASWFMN
jgi:hypothetical protein